jgi:hypothetical protein
MQPDPAALGLRDEHDEATADERELQQATAEIDRTLIQLALARSLRERLRAGVAMARLASRFQRETAPNGR